MRTRYLVLIALIFIVFYFFNYNYFHKKYSYEEYFEDIQFSELIVSSNLKSGYGFFDLAVVLLNPSLWTPEIVQDEMSKASQILSQCQVEIGKVVLISVAPKNKVVDFDALSSVAFLKNLPREIRPVVVLFRYTLQHTMVAWAFWTTNIIQDVESDTTFISDQITTKDYKIMQNIAYSPVAHELVHILARMRHTPQGTKNLMGDQRWEKNSLLTSEQCQRIRSNNLVKRTP